MAARLSLAQQIALLEEPAPVDVDLEDVHAPDIQNSVIAEPSAREHYVDVGSSLLRKQHDSISDPKYGGVIVTRKQVTQESSDEEMDHDGAESEEDKKSSELEDDVSRASLDSAEDPPSDEDKSPLSEEEQETSAPIRKGPPREPEDSEHISKGGLSAELRKKGVEERTKGMAVSRQLALWDTLLDARIRIQKAVTGASRLPPPLEVKESLVSPEYKTSVEKLLKETTLLSNEIFQLQEYLLESNESLTAPAPKRRKIETGGDVDVDFEQWLEDATEDASTLEKFYHPHVVQTLTKWSSKIQAVSPSVLLPSNRGAFSSRRSQHTKNVLEVIDEVTADSNKLLARTQVRRTGTAAARISENKQEEDPNVFDDTDFYQQMLRDVIDAKGNSSGGDWMVAQKQKKVKKTVDTKASKGRKLRYETHEKMQNFMVPVPVVGGWHEEQVDELFASLLGKGFRASAPDIAVEEAEERQEAATLNEALKDGFRVFG